MKHRLRKEHEPETYWIPPPNARVEFVPDPEIVRMRESLPSYASSADVNVIPIYHTDQGTFDEGGRPMADPKRPYKEVALDAWREDLAAALPSDPRHEEVDGLSDCVCAGCLRREVISFESVTNMLATPGPAAGSRLEITVTTPVVTTVETIFPPTPISELAAEAPFAHDIIQQGHSAFFDSNLHTEEPSQLVVPAGPYFQGQLSTLPIESNDMLDLFSAAPNLRFKVGLIQLPYRGQCTAPHPSRLLSGGPMSSSSQPLQDDFDLSLLHNIGFHNELLAARDGTWSGVHAARSDLLEFIQLVTGRMTNDTTSPTCESTARIVRAERQSHIDYKRDMNSHAVERYLIAQRTLECFEDSRRIRDEEITKLVNDEAEQEQDAAWLRIVQDAIVPSIGTPRLSTPGMNSQTDIGMVSQPPRDSGATPPAIVCLNTRARTHESTESELGPISPVEEPSMNRPLAHFTSSSESYDVEYRFPQKYMFPPKHRFPQSTKEIDLALNTSRSTYLAAPLYPHAPECSNGVAYFESATFQDQSQAPRLGLPYPSVAAGLAHSALDPVGQAGWTLESGHLARETRPPLQGRANPRGFNHDASTALDGETRGSSRSYNPFSRTSAAQ